LKYLLFTIAILLSCRSVDGQQQSSSVKTKQSKKAPDPPPPAKLSDSFAKAALLALKNIESYVRPPTFRDGDMLVDRHTSELIDSADIEAVSAQERTIAAKLNGILVDKIANNVTRESIRIKHKEAADREYKEAEDRAKRGGTALTVSWLDFLNELSGSDPESIAINAREAACFGALEEGLRRRIADFPSKCDSIAPRR
jgi:hypothetical protein